MLISLLLRLLSCVLLIMPLHVSAMGTPRTGLHHVDIFHAAVDYSAQIILELDTFCSCPDLVNVSVDIVRLSDESYEYQFRDSFILNHTRLLAFTLAPFISLDDHRSISIQIESEDSLDTRLHNYIYTISPQPSKEYRVEFGADYTSPEPTKTRINWYGPVLDYYDHLQLYSELEDDVKSPVIPLSQWVLSIDSPIVWPERFAATFTLTSDDFPQAYQLPVNLIRQEDNLFAIVPDRIFSNIIDAEEGLPNHHDARFDPLMGMAFIHPIQVHGELIIPSRSQGRYTLIVEADWQWSEPLFGACDQSYYCFHRSTTPILTDIPSYISFRMEGS